jgi:gliding motility associated protien GldN
MKTLSKIACTLSIALMAGTGFAQNVLDGTFVDENTPARRVIPYTFLRQADVLWSQRIWRIIDLREKENLTLYYPLKPNANRECLWDIIRTAIKSGELTAYEDNSLVDLDNTFSVPLTKAKILSIIEPVDSTLTDENGNPLPPVAQPLEPNMIRGYMLKEDWFFDRQRSVMDVRILGIAPMMVPINKNTKQEDTTGGLSALFWIYFPQARPLFAVKEVFNTHSDAERRTYEDIFWKRQFSSYIFQESNVYNRPLAAYANTTPLDRLLEGEKIKKKMFDIEHDMWQY